ncbi:MAG: M20/M25/M40 family metallo-hydrolase [Leeuwenhoekiella sp.]
MKKYASLFSFLLLLGFVYLTFFLLKPSGEINSDVPLEDFSTARAMQHVEAIAQVPHSVGTEGHQQVQDYIIEQLKTVGLEPQIQEGFAYEPGWGKLSKAENILCRIPGSGDGRALLLLSHYDSSPQTGSFGASDAGSGVATVLEGIRAFLKKGTTPKNDIIILFTDAEELGLNGAKLFTTEHRWAKDVDLALNFEARGSGGPAMMVVETNGGNGGLIKAFSEAGAQFPYANSLIYSIYKILPNDTDSTVLRSKEDIDGYFFAFIGDHFDYHTAMDTPERLDLASLAHQGSYLMPLLEHFADAPLQVKSDTDFVYFNFPLVKMLYYPFYLVWPLVLLGWIAFVAILIYGFRRKKWNGKQLSKGFLPLFFSLIAAYIISLLWQLTLVLKPEFRDILHGFPYNGYELLAGAVALTLAVIFAIYHLFLRKGQSAGLSMAPIFLWMVINTGIAWQLPGASFFMIPVLFAMVQVFLQLKNIRPHLFLITLLSAPVVFIISAYIKDFPVALGLKILIASTMLTVLLFGLLLPVLGKYRFMPQLSVLFLAVATGAFISAYAKSDFNIERPFPTSLSYVYDVAENQAYYATYNKNPDAWVKTVLGENPQPASEVIPDSRIGKYGLNYTFASGAPLKPVAPSSIYTSQDSVVDGQRELSFGVFPQRAVQDMMVVAANDMAFSYLEINGQEVFDIQKNSSDPLTFRKGRRFIGYRVSNREPLEITFRTADTTQINFELWDYSYDLLEHPEFTIESRPEATVPMPFVFTDAIITRQAVTFDRN